MQRCRRKVVQSPLPAGCQVEKSWVEERVVASHTRSNRSPSPLEPARGSHHRHRLIHHPLPNTEVAVDPLLHVFAVGDLIGVETGAVKSPRTHTSLTREVRRGQLS